MNFEFRACTLDQPLLLAPSLQQWLPEGHLARFIADVTEQLDLSAIYSAHDRRDGRGQAGYHPLLMTRLPLYGCCVGVASSASHRADDLLGCGVPLSGGGPASGSRHHSEFSETTSGEAGGTICASLAIVPEGRIGEAGARSHRWHKDPGECEQTQSHELRADGGSGAETAGRSGNPAAPCRGSGRGRRSAIW